MDRLLQERNQKYRLVTAEDEQLIIELRLRYTECRDQIKALERQPIVTGEELDLKYARLQTLRRAAYRLEQLAQQDHLKRFRRVAA